MQGDHDQWNGNKKKGVPKVPGGEAKSGFFRWFPRVPL
jgi:hypothetical protein